MIKKAYQIETLALFVAGSTGILGWIMPHWILSLIVYTLGFGLSSLIITLLKEETIFEYIVGTNEKNAKERNSEPKKEVSHGRK